MASSPRTLKPQVVFAVVAGNNVIDVDRTRKYLVARVEKRYGIPWKTLRTEDGWWITKVRISPEPDTTEVGHG